MESPEKKDSPRANAEFQITYLRNNPDGLAYNLDTINEQLAKAKEAGTDVSDLEAQLPELARQLARANAEFQITYLRNNPNTLAYNLDTINEQLTKAKEAGADVSDLEAQLPELAK